MSKNGRRHEPGQPSWYVKGCLLADAGRLTEAVTAFSAAIDGKDELARAYFRRGVCHYLLSNDRQASMDLDAASLLGCQDALLWSRYDCGQSAS